MSLEEAFKNITSSAKGSLAKFDWETYKKLGQDFIKDSKKIGLATAKKVEEHTIEISNIVTKAAKGELDAVAAKRSVERNISAITSYLQGAGEALSWNTAQKYWSASKTAIDFVTLFFSALIKSI